MSRLGKMKRQVILEANQRNLGIIKETPTGVTNNTIVKLHNEEELHDSIHFHFGLDHEINKSFLENLLNNSHIHINPLSNHVTLQLSHMGKQHDITLEIDGSFGHDYHHSNEINLDLQQNFGFKVTLPIKRSIKHSKAIS